MSLKIHSLLQLYEVPPENERLIVDVLRQIVKETLPSYCKEKISFNVPYFYGKKGICIIWPATIPRGGIKQGVCSGFGMVTDYQMSATILHTEQQADFLQNLSISG
ncbi:MAG: hypothetical protein JST48_15060 [Bacteroidetes bacterium]|nr:hypothetical protein [Bacteroidota bacterium]